jgi:acetyltransferase-like isoleucine patch superfamily enzyme
MVPIVKFFFNRILHRQGSQTDITGLLLPEYEVGKETYGKPEVLSWGSTSTLRIGSYCSIGGNVQILLGGNHRIDWVTTFPFPARWKEASAITGHPASKGDVVIENDIWIGRQSVILSGVTIHTGAVVACNSVVTRNVPPYTIVGGNPAREIKKRFSESQIARLLASRWWELDRESLVDLLPLLCSAAIDTFCDTVEKKVRM